jgi:hypothetical protein
MHQDTAKALRLFRDRARVLTMANEIRSDAIEVFPSVEGHLATFGAREGQLHPFTNQAPFGKPTSWRGLQLHRFRASWAETYEIPFSSRKWPVHRMHRHILIRHSYSIVDSLLTP